MAHESYDRDLEPVSEDMPVLDPDPRHVRAVFHPILNVDVEGVKVHGVEGLVRPVDVPSLPDAERLFAHVRRHHLETAMDRVCIVAILRAATALPAAWRLFVNVHASTLAGSTDIVDFMLDAAREHGVAPERLVVEIVEYGGGPKTASLRPTLERFRLHGIGIAVDDVGAGQSNLHKLLDCQPDYIKLDRHFVTSCHRDHYRHAILEALSALAGRVGARLVAEGVEELEELRVVRQLHIELVQGFLFCKPMSAHELLERFSHPPMNPKDGP
jgi:EAL domain-containing protein (putative c-di-GMP-specific phosphodiesterase class I)